MENNEQKLFFGQTEKEYEEKHKDARKAINKYERGELLRAGKSVLAAPLSMIGVKGYWDVPMYLKQKLGLKGTKKRLKKDLGNLEQENITESDIEALEEREYGTRVAEVLDTAKIGELQDDIENDKNLSEESKNNLLEELNGLIENYSEERDGLRGEQKEKATNLLNEYAETKISGIQAAREGLRSFLIASGGFTAALGGYAITDGVGRYLNLEKKERRKAEKQETEKKKTKILKDVIVDGITKTFKNLTFTGEKKGVGRKSFDSVIAFANIFKYSGMAVASRESGGFGEMFKKVSEAGEGGLTVEKVGELLKSYGGDIKSGMKKGLDNILSTLKFEKSLGEMGENHKEAFKRVFSLPFGKERTDKILKIVGEYPGKIGDFMVGSASAAEGAPFALENIDSNDGNATIVSKDDGLNAIKLGVTSEKETNIGTEELPKNVAGDLGNNNDAETQQPITASVVNQQTGEDGNATTKVSSMENPIVPEPKLTKTEEMQKVYDEFVKNLEVKKEQTLDREKFQMLFLQKAINNGFDKNDIEGFLNKMSIDSPDMKLGEATEVDLTELRGEFKRGDSLWSTSRKFLEAKYDKDFGLVDKSTDEINALKTYNIDRMKDKIIEIISGRDDDLRRDCGLKGITDPNKVTLSQLKKIDFEEIYEKTFCIPETEEGLTQDLKPEAVKSINEHNKILEEYFEEHKGAPRTSEEYDNVIAAFDKGETDVENIYNALHSTENGTVNAGGETVKEEDWNKTAENYSKFVEENNKTAGWYNKDGSDDDVSTFLEQTSFDEKSVMEQESLLTELKGESNSLANQMRSVEKGSESHDSLLKERDNINSLRDFLLDYHDDQFGEDLNKYETFNLQLESLKEEVKNTAEVLLNKRLDEKIFNSRNWLLQKRSFTDEFWPEMSKLSALKMLNHEDFGHELNGASDLTEEKLLTYVKEIKKVIGSPNENEKIGDFLLRGEEYKARIDFDIDAKETEIQKLGEKLGARKTDINVSKKEIKMSDGEVLHQSPEK